MYLRFQGRVPNLGTASKLGVFQLAIELRDREDTPLYVSNEIQRHLTWFDQCLRAPDLLDDWKNYRAICWFKPDADEPLDRIWSMKALLDDFGFLIELLKTSRPGQIIYEDEWQIAAKPRRR